MPRAPPRTTSPRTRRAAAGGPALHARPTIDRANTGAPGNTPTGTVTFQDTAYFVAGPDDLQSTTTVLASGVALDGTGHASCNTSALSAGSHFITAVYSGDGTFSAGSVVLVQRVHDHASSTTLASSLNPSGPGRAVTFTATVVSVPPGSGTPTGMVIFQEGPDALAQVPLDGGGAASFTTSALSPGAHTITAIYVSDPRFASSDASLTQAVGTATYSIPGFSDTAVVSGLSQPTAFTWTPDGRMLILEKAGRVRIVVDGVLQGTAALDISASVDSGVEKGLLGICLDPGFAINGHVYLYYTNLVPQNRISRFTMSGDTLVPGTESVILDHIDATNGNHNGGHVDVIEDDRFGPGNERVARHRESRDPVLRHQIGVVEIDVAVDRESRIEADPEQPLFHAGIDRGRDVQSRGPLQHAVHHNPHAAGLFQNQHPAVRRPGERGRLRKSAHHGRVRESGDRVRGGPDRLSQACVARGETRVGNIDRGDGMSARAQSRRGEGGRAAAVERDLGQGIRALLEDHHARRRPGSRGNGNHRGREGNRPARARRIERGSERGGRSMVMDPLNQDHAAGAEGAVSAVNGGDEVTARGQGRGVAARVACSIQGDAGRQDRGRTLEIVGAGHEVGGVLEGDGARGGVAGSAGVCDRRYKSERIARDYGAVAGGRGGEGNPHAGEASQREESTAVQRVNGPIGADDGRHVGLPDAGGEP